MVQEISFKDICYLELWRPEWNHLCNFGWEQYGEQSSEIILNLDKWFRRRCHSKKKFTHDGLTHDRLRHDRRRTPEEDRSQ